MIDRLEKSGGSFGCGRSHLFSRTLVFFKPKRKKKQIAAVTAVVVTMVIIDPFSSPRLIPLSARIRLFRCPDQERSTPQTWVG